MTVSGLDITGNVYIGADNVTLENCRITTSTGDYASVIIPDGVEGAVVRNNDINGAGETTDYGIYGHGTFEGNNIWNAGNGINVSGNGAVIKDNYIHDLLEGGAPHYDGIEVNGNVDGLLIEHNTIENPYDQTSAVRICDPLGPVSNVTVNDNVLIGGGYTINSNHFADKPYSISDVSFTNNHIGGGAYGPTYFTGPQPTYTGNVEDGMSIYNSLTLDGHNTQPVGDPVSSDPVTADPPADTGTQTGDTGTHTGDTGTGDTGTQTGDSGTGDTGTQAGDGGTSSGTTDPSSGSTDPSSGTTDPSSGSGDTSSGSDWTHHHHWGNWSDWSGGHHWHDWSGTAKAVTDSSADATQTADAGTATSDTSGTGDHFHFSGGTGGNAGRWGDWSNLADQAQTGTADQAGPDQTHHVASTEVTGDSSHDLSAWVQQHMHVPGHDFVF